MMRRTASLRPVQAIASLLLAASLMACPPAPSTANPGEGEGEEADDDEICDNGEDDDNDGRTDCDDSRDCRDDPACAGEGEGEGDPGGENCTNGVDDDGDGDVDCEDVECLFNSPVCAGDEICGNGLDDDDDGDTDCDDADCLADPDCNEPVPEDCDNGLDDDGDGNTDCDDGNCLIDPACVVDAEDCDNGLDDDGDGDVDCDDVSCADAGVCDVPAVGIAAIREASDGDINVQVDDAFISVIKPLVGADVAGFFAQQGATGPAIFVAVDPDTVGISTGFYSFRATARATVSGMVHVTDIIDVVAGVDLPAPPPQSLSAATDIVSNLAAYESEYIELQGTVTGAPGNAGTGHQSVTIDTDGVVGQAGALRVRFPTEVGTAVLASEWLGCTITMTGAMWRFNTNAQPSFWNESDVNVDNCSPAAIAVTASTTSTVSLAFGRSVDASSVVPENFTLNNGATVTGATLAGRVVTLTTSALAGSYTVTVADVVDVLGFPADGSAPFTVGAVSAGGLVINEIDYDQTGTDSAEFIELFNGGATTIDLAGFELVHINGATGNNIIFRMDLTGVIAPGGYALFGAVGGPAFPASLQNGPDAVALLDGAGELVDGIAYDTAAAIGIVDASLAIDIADPSGAEGGSLCRVPDGGDFGACLSASPGSTNP
jgi:hypothetical protein